MVSPADDETQSTPRRGDLLFVGGALVGVGLFLFLAKDLSSVTGILRPELTAAIAIAMVILGVFAVVLEVGHVLELSARARRATRRVEAAAAPVGNETQAPQPQPQPQLESESGSGSGSVSVPEPEVEPLSASHPASFSELGAEPEPEPEPEVEPEPLGIHAVGYVALSVSDRDRSLAWYTEVLGFEEAFRQDGGTRRVSVMRFGPGGYSVGLVERLTAGEMRFDPARQGLDHLAFAVRSREELVAWEQRLTDAAVPHSAVVDIPPGAIVNLTDPDGIGLALFWDRSATPSATG